MSYWPLVSFLLLHQWGRHVILNHLIKDGVIKIVYSELGIPQIELRDIDRIHKSLGNLWSVVQKAKSTGDYEMAKSILMTLGRMTKEQQAWPLKMVQAKKMLKIPEYIIYLQPIIELVKNEQGSIIDVRLNYEPKDKKSIDFVLDREQVRIREDARRIRDCRANLKLFL